MTTEPTEENWLQCSGCNMYCSDDEIAASDQQYQWCESCLGKKTETEEEDP